ncbi:MAG: pentapeptide repeat-containing protein [Mycobacteriales bacterium]
MDTGDWQRASSGEYVDVDLAGVRLRNVNLEGAKLSEALLVNARLCGLITGLVINNVEVAPLIEAELNRREPDRALMTPVDLAGVRRAWEIVRRRWDETRERAAALPEPLLHQRVDDEWSFLETVRHLIMVIDGCIGSAILGRSDRHPTAWPQAS